MHIPDGYLSPQTCAVMYVVAAPLWARAVAVMRKTFTQKTIPVLAMLAAFSFLIMMFNVPIPGGTTAHAVGGTLIAIILGPWAALIGESLALIIQALFFGDGGITAIGANCFNMGFVLPFVGFFIYRLITRGSAFGSRRSWIGAAVGGYIGINVAAVVAAIEFGIQPSLFHTASGAPLYCPYDLSQAIPAMLLAHLTVAGPIEAAITGGVVAYLGKHHPEILKLNPHERRESDEV